MSSLHLSYFSTAALSFLYRLKCVNELLFIFDVALNTDNAPGMPSAAAHRYIFIIVITTTKYLSFPGHMDYVRSECTVVVLKSFICWFSGKIEGQFSNQFLINNNRSVNFFKHSIIQPCKKTTLLYLDFY